MSRMLTRVLAVAAALVAGCATVQKESFIKEQAGDYVYQMPVEQVWPHVTAMLEEQGYSYRKVPDQFLVVTEWKEENGASSMGASFSRYMAEGQRIDDTHCRVRFVRHTMSSAPVGDLTMTSTERHAAQATAASNAAAHGAAGRAGTAAAGVRDLNAEWLLMLRAAPEDAKEIQQEADKRFP